MTHREVTEMPEDWLPLLKRSAGKQSRGAFVRELIEAGIRARLKRRSKLSQMKKIGRPNLTK